MKIRVASLLLIASAIVLGPRPLRAAPDPAVVEARKHFEEGTKAFNLGEFDRAAKEYKAAYNAKPDPVILYNIAQACRLGNELSQALFFYRSFLRNQPNTPNRKEIEERIHQLETQIAEHKSHPEPAPTPAPAAPAPDSPSATPPATPPAPAEAASPTSSEAPHATAAEITATPPAPAPARRPLYKKGWFWGVVVTSVVVAAGVGVGLGLGLTRDSTPSSALGNQRVFGLVGGTR